MLLAGAGLMIRTFLALQHVDPGFDPHGVLSMVVGVSGTEQAAAGRTGNFYQALLQRVSVCRECNRPVASTICRSRVTNGV